MSTLEGLIAYHESQARVVGSHPDDTFHTNACATLRALLPSAADAVAEIVEGDDGTASIQFVPTFVESQWIVGTKLFTRPASARPSAGVGELALSEQKSLEQRAMGWDAVCGLLFELRPEWTLGTGTGIELATAAIREALSAPVAPAAEDVVTRLLDLGYVTDEEVLHAQVCIDRDRLEAAAQPGAK